MSQHIAQALLFVTGVALIAYGPGRRFYNARTPRTRAVLRALWDLVAGVAQVLWCALFLLAPRQLPVRGPSKARKLPILHTSSQYRTNDR